MYTSNVTLSELSEGSANHWKLIKTRLAIFQPLITVLASSMLSFIAGQHLPCVTAITPSSSITTATSLIIFTVSAIVTLVLVAYLVKLSVSRVCNKKEACLSKEVLNKEQQPKKMIKKTALESEPIGERFNKTLKKQGSGTQMEVVDSSINLKGKSSAQYTPIQLSLVPDTATPHTDTAKPPHSVVPPFPLASGLSGSSSSKGANGSSMLEAGVSNNANNANQESSKDILLEQIKKGVKLRHTKNTNVQQKQPVVTGQNQDMVLVLNIALAQRRIAIKSSDSESEHSSSNSSSDWSTDEERLKKKRLTKHREKSMPQALPSENEKGNRTPESGYRSGNDTKPEFSSLSHSTPKVDKPSVSPKPANLQMRSKISLVKERSSKNPVESEIQDPSTLSFKERMSRFGN